MLASRRRRDLRFAFAPGGAHRGAPGMRPVKSDRRERGALVELVYRRRDSTFETHSLSLRTRLTLQAAPFFPDLGAGVYIHMATIPGVNGDVKDLTHADRAKSHTDCAAPDM